MSYFWTPEKHRRSDARVPLDVVYSEHVRERQLLGVIVDASERGLRVQRIPRRLGQPERRLQLEFALPGAGESIWALGEIVFDRIAPVPATSSLVRTSGVRIVEAAGKHLALLRDFVREAFARGVPAPRGEPPVATRADDDHWLMRASCFR